MKSDKFKPLPEDEFIAVHGEWSLECGDYKSGDERVRPGDILLTVESNRYTYHVYGENKYTSGPTWLIHRDGGPAVEERDGTRLWYNMYICVREECGIHGGYRPWPPPMEVGEEFNLEDGEYKTGDPKVILEGDHCLLVSRDEVCYYKRIEGEWTRHRADGPTRIWAGGDPEDYEFYLNGDMVDKDAGVRSTVVRR